MTNQTNCYDLPQYWDLAFDDDTQDEADFVVAAAAKYCDFPLAKLYEPGCGGGRLVTELASRGYEVTGTDLSAASVEFANTRLKSAGDRGKVVAADMRTFRSEQAVDVAYCLVNTFRHLLTEDDAVEHLQNVAASVRPGGLYIIGMHLLPPDADEEDEEQWSVTKDNVTVNMQLVVAGCDRETRQETLRFQMEVLSETLPETLTFDSDYRMRIYEADQMRGLLSKVTEFELLDVYDFWYDITDPLTLSDEMGDTVFVLKRT